MKCGTCGDMKLVIRPKVVVGWIEPGYSGFDLFCGQGHQWVPVPGEEWVIETGTP